MKLRKENQKYNKNLAKHHPMNIMNITMKIRKYH